MYKKHKVVLFKDTNLCDTAQKTIDERKKMCFNLGMGPTEAAGNGTRDSVKFHFWKSEEKV